VDPLGTLLDPSLPLTVNEWEEFGDPRTAEGLAALAALSPTHNVPPSPPRLPPLLLRPALQDARTQWWEAFKLAAAVRAAGGEACVDMDYEGGHFRPAARTARARDRAVGLAFLIDELEKELKRLASFSI